MKHFILIALSVIIAAWLLNTTALGAPTSPISPISSPLPLPTCAPDGSNAPCFGALPTPTPAPTPTQAAAVAITATPTATITPASTSEPIATPLPPIRWLCVGLTSGFVLCYEW